MTLWQHVACDMKKRNLHEVYKCGHKSVNTFSQFPDTNIGLNDLKYVTKTELCEYAVNKYRNTLDKVSNERDCFDLREASFYYITQPYFDCLEEDEI